MTRGRLSKSASLIVVILAFMLIAMSLMVPKAAHAANHSASAVYGFSVDKDVYDVSWDENRSASTYKNGAKIGATYIRIGKARSKEMFEGKYLTTYMINIKTSPQIASFSRRVLWWTDRWSEYGINKSVQITSTLPSNVSLLETGPKFTASDTQYSIGINAGVDSSGASAGISGGVGFTSKAIDITNNSNTLKRKVDIKIALNESIWRWNWERYKYANQENTQLMSFSVLSDREFYLDIDITAVYGTVDRKPSYWMNNYSGSYSSVYNAYTYSK